MEGPFFLFHRKTSRNFNPPIAKAGKITIVEVEEIVETGELDAENIHLPGVYVQRVVKGPKYEKRIEVQMQYSEKSLGGSIITYILIPLTHINLC